MQLPGELENQAHSHVTKYIAPSLASGEDHPPTLVTPGTAIHTVATRLHYCGPKNSRLLAPQRELLGSLRRNISE